jgi:2-dehydro-3-deoxygluconokinase
MNKSIHCFTALKKNRIIALLTPKNPEECIQAQELLDPYGITLEIALRSECALEGIRALCKKHTKALILAGTVMTREQARQAIRAGAAGIVSADYIPDVVEECVQQDIMVIPGGLADTGKQLVQKAGLYGLDLNSLRENKSFQWSYKLFPAFAGSTSNIEIASSWKGPYPGLTIVYTGGVSLENISRILHRDPAGIVCGSALTKRLDSPEDLKEEAQKWRRIVHGEKIHIDSQKDIASSAPCSVPKMVTFGELMLRLSPPDHQRFVQASHFDISFGGAEANTAVAFALYGLQSLFVTAMPEHEIGQAAVNALRMQGIDTSNILRRGKRLGIYYLEHGASQRPSKVIYDRAGSAITEIRPGDIDWKSVFKNAAWFHWSGITPALSDSLAEVTLEALKAAKEAERTVSVDLNYRKKLWSRDKARSVMTPLMDYVDIAIGNEEDAFDFFGYQSGKTDVKSAHLDADGYKETAQKMADRFGLSKVAVTLRESISASDNRWSACLYNGTDFLHSRSYPVHIVDRVGGGDAFSSGLIYGLVTGKSDQEALDFGTAASCLKQTIPGDFNRVSVEEVQRLLAGDASGRVLR